MPPWCSGTIGNWILYLVGLMLSIPMLRRLGTRFRSRWALVMGAALFAGLFVLSAYVVGPSISGGGVPQPAGPAPTQQHEGHRWVGGTQPPRSGGPGRIIDLPPWVRTLKDGLPKGGRCAVRTFSSFIESS